MIPLVHMNGTSGNALAKQLRDAGRAVHDAMDKLQEAAPHGRDYYPSPDQDAYRKASRQFQARYDKLRAVYDELVQLHELVQEQVNVSEGRRWDKTR